MHEATASGRVRRLALIATAMALSACDVSVGKGGLSLGIAAGRASDEWTRSYDLAAGGRFELVNMNGRIEVTGTDGSTVEVRAEREVKAGSDEAAQELLRALEIAEEVTGDRVRLETRSPAKSFGTSYEVRYAVRVPAGLHVDVETMNGGVSVNGVTGGVRASTMNGGISGRELAGGLEASTTNGGIRVDLVAVDSGPVTLETVNGGIDVRVPETARADLSARCTNGRITVSGLALETSESSRRRLEGRLNGGGGVRIDLETTNGGIRVSRRS